MLATACTTLPPPVDNTPRRYHDVIELSGRLSIRYEQDHREQAVHGNFTWNQSERNIVLSLRSPLGQTLATIDIQPGMAVLTQAGKAPLAAANVDTLTQQVLGWPLPVSSLRDWLQGFGYSADGQPFVAQPSRDTLRYTTPDGWLLSYNQWQDHARPKRIELTRDTKQVGPVLIRIVIDQWQSQ